MLTESTLGISSAGSYEIVRKPDSPSSREGNNGYLCTIPGDLPFGGKYGLSEYLGSLFQIQNTHLDISGTYYDRARPAYSLKFGHNFLLAEGQYHHFYNISYDRGSTKTIHMIMEEIGGFQRSLPEPTIIPDPRRKGSIDLLMKETKLQGKQKGRRKWGGWIEYKPGQPGGLVSAVVDWLNIAIEEQHLAIRPQ